MSTKPRIAVTGSSPERARRLAETLADEARWDIVAQPGAEAADAFVLLARDEDEAALLQSVLPPPAPVLWLGAAPPEETGPAHGGATGRLPGGADVGQMKAALAAILAGLSVRVAEGAVPASVRMRTGPRGTQVRAAAVDVSSGPGRAGNGEDGAAARPAAHAGATPTALAAHAGETIEALTSRELEVFELLAKGLSNRDIAGVLGISAHTAKFHVAQILAKVGAATRAEAVAIGLRLGLIGM